MTSHQPLVSQSKHLFWFDDYHHAGPFDCIPTLELYTADGGFHELLSRLHLAAKTARAALEQANRNRMQP